MSALPTTARGTGNCWGSRARRSSGQESRTARDAVVPRRTERVAWTLGQPQDGPRSLWAHVLIGTSDRRGWVYPLEKLRNAIFEHHVDAGEFARKLDVLLDCDEVEKESTYA